MKPSLDSPWLSVFVISRSLLLLSALPGCAALGLQSAPEIDDPVAEAAARFRSPASSPSTDSRVGDAVEARGRDFADSRPKHLRLGMGMDEVSGIWGSPHDVETAITSPSENQKWVYYTGLSSRWGLGSKRVVFFENGRVAGWKSGD